MDGIFDITKLTRLAVEHGLRVLLIIALTLTVAKVVRGLLGRLESRLAVEDSKAGRNLHRSSTLVSVLRSLFSVGIWMLSGVMVLDELAVPVGPLLTGAGIAGVAIGFGAQSVVRDFVSGFFVLLEDQYRVGDAVDIGIIDGVQVSGTVERFSLRSTALRESTGALHQVPNGVVQVVSNRSAGWSQATLDVGVGVDEDLTEVREAFHEACAELAADELVGKLITGDPEILGVEDLSDSRVTMRMVVRTAPGKQADVERGLRLSVKEVFDRRGITTA